MLPKLTDDEAASLAINSFSPPAQLAYAQKEALSTVTATLQDPAPFIEDISTLSTAYSTLYFRSLLQLTTTVSWSTRMTSCAGTCSLVIDKETSRPKDPRECAVRLSEALLKYRPRSDTLDTLLHEMIHAYLFIAGGKHVRGDDPTGHGSGFQRLASAINEHGGYDITTTHSFHDEVESYQTHVWQCTGTCRDLPPYFGIVRRAMNRAPGPSDSWYQEHQERCQGGMWEKVAEPPPKKGKEVQRNKIDKWLVKGKEGEGKSEEEATKKKRPPPNNDDVGPLGNKEDSSKRPKTREVVPVEKDSVHTSLRPVGMVDCPVCAEQVLESEINAHLDTVHGF